MSLDVYLRMNAVKSGNELDAEGVGEPRIFIRENGQTKEISRAEWDERFPGREPVTVARADEDFVYTSNITHNLVEMASDSGLYKWIWRPEEIGVTRAAELIQPLREGLVLLTGDPGRFKYFNPPNGWGTYEGLCVFVKSYLAACECWPEAEISVSR